MEHAALYITQFGYLALFPLAIAEGPIVTVIGGFFVRLGILSPLIVYIVVVVGDMLGDTLYYAIGRFGRNSFLSWIGRHIGVTHDQLEGIRTHFANHGYKTIATAKLLQGLGPVGLIAAGGAHVPYPRYMLMCFSVSLIQSAVFLGIGYLFGHAYMTLSHYLNVFAGVVSITLALLVVWFAVYKWKKP